MYCQIAAGSNGTGFAELNLPDSSGSFTVRGPEKAAYVFRLDNQAECNHNGGTITFSLTAENHPSIMDVTSLRGTGVNNILVTQTVSSASSGGVLEFVGNDTVKGNLTLTGNGSQSCLVDTNFTGAGLTVDGDVTVNNHSTFINRTTNTGNYSFGSLTINSGGTYNATSGTTTITTGAFDITTTSFDLGAKTLVFSGTNASFLSATNATFSAGPGATITGKAADDKTDFDCQKNFQVVGTVENLNNNGPGSLMVTGKVINCDGNIIQLKPTQDSEQQLDKSSEADRETTLGRDLDSNTELVG